MTVIHDSFRFADTIKYLLNWGHGIRLFEKKYRWYHSFRLLIAIPHTLFKEFGPKRDPVEDAYSEIVHHV